MGGKFCSYNRPNTYGVISGVIVCKDFPVVTY